jgi:hypothetical protein
MEELIGVLFGPKGDKLVQTNIRAFRYGRANGELFSHCVGAGADAAAVLGLMDHLSSATLDPAAAGLWAEVLASPMQRELEALWQAEPGRMLAGTADVPRLLLTSGIASLTAARS